MRLLSLTIGGTNGQSYNVKAPGGVPTGGLDVLTVAIQNILTILLGAGVILALFFLIFGGIKWITSGGEKEGVESARKMITFSIIGLVIVFLSFFILNFVGGIFGVNLIKYVGPSFTQTQFNNRTQHGNADSTIAPNKRNTISNPAPRQTLGPDGCGPLGCQ